MATLDPLRVNWGVLSHQGRVTEQGLSRSQVQLGSGSEAFGIKAVRGGAGLLVELETPKRLGKIDQIRCVDHLSQIGGVLAQAGHSQKIGADLATGISSGS